MSIQPANTNDLKALKDWDIEEGQNGEIILALYYHDASIVKTQLSSAVATELSVELAKASKAA